jgi:20S proteasome subunit beta 2
MGLIYFDDDYGDSKIFGFENFRRNEIINNKIKTFLSIKKTGTTIAGLVFDKGVILGADTRATNGNISCDNNCQKIHYLAPNICCMGAGTSADAENITKILFYQLELQRLSTKRESRVLASLIFCKDFLYKHNGNISAALILGGFDILGPQLFSVHPHGSTESLPFISMGSGSLAAISVLENSYNCSIDLNSALTVIKESVLAGILNDSGSGNNIDICIILEDTLILNRNVHTSNNFLFLNKNIKGQFENC